jgi:hypothetical protein
LALFFFIFFYFAGLSPTGLLFLSTEKTSEAKDSVKAVKDTPAITAALSFKVIKPAKLGVEFISGKVLPCPRYSFLEFKARNQGKEPVERLFVEPSSSLKVLECINCSLPVIAPGEEKIVKLKACGVFEKEFSVEFSSINAGKKTIKIG